MAFARRKDMGVRTAGEKAQLPDEFLTRSQVLPGNNISFDYLANNDIIINANISIGPGGDTIIGSDCCKRMLSTSITFGFLNQNIVGGSIIPDTETPFAEAHQMGEYTTNDSKKKYFGQVYYADIVHNWGLTYDNHSFLINIVDQSSVYDIDEGLFSLKSQLKAVGISPNMIRIYGTVPSYLAPAHSGNHTPTVSYNSDPHWRANANTKVGVKCFNPAIEMLSRTYRVTLQEYK